MSQPDRDANGIPYYEPFAFGLYECACCTGDCYGDRKTFVLKKPLFADYERTEVLIPAGRQSFHPDCLERVRTEIESEAKAS